MGSQGGGDELITGDANFEIGAATAFGKPSNQVAKGGDRVNEAIGGFWSKLR
uniref:Uncharacterized protein n=1 Tax=Desertifilum tharense IPPAS B-1220 TaxID=1781255 RepID=A0ACD5GWI9_9CYAN